MADKGISVISHNGEDYNINDPNIAGEFYPNSNYAVGDHVTHEGKLYVFTAAHTGAWTGTDVTQVQIGAELHDYGAHAMVRYDVAQTLTDAQKTVARNNIGAASGSVVSEQGVFLSNLSAAVGTVPTGETVEGQITDLKSAISPLEPTATSEDIGKTLVAKTVTNGKVSEYELATIISGLTDEAKTALLNCFAHVAWIDEHGRDYYDALYSALYNQEPPAPSLFKYGRVDSSSAITGSYIDADGSIKTATSSSGYYDDYIDVKGLASILIHYEGEATYGAYNVRISIYDANKIFTRQIHINGANGNYVPVEFQNGESYIRLGWYSATTPAFWLESTSPLPLVMEIGDIDGSTGQDKTSNLRIRTKEYIPVTGKISVEDCPWGGMNWLSFTESDMLGKGGYFFRCYNASYEIIGTLIGPNNTMYDVDIFEFALPENTAYVRMEAQKVTGITINAGFSNNTHPFAINGISYQITEE